MLIRLAEDRDAEAIRTIYNPFVLTSTVTFDLEPRSLEQQRAWLRDRSGAHAVLVAEIDGETAGFASLSPYRMRAAYSTSVEDSVYVADHFQGRGVGSNLLGAILDVAADHGFHSVLAKIVDGHAASIALHEAHGFELVGIEREIGRKFNKWLDVALMQKLLD
jgi:phosphinothricin acetyltransferase